MRNLMIILCVGILFFGCVNVETALKTMDGLNYLNYKDLKDRVDYDNTIQLPNNDELQQIILEAKPNIYAILNKVACSGSEEYIKKVLFQFSPNNSETQIKFPFNDIVDENNQCLNVTKIYDFSSIDNRKLNFLSTFTTEKQKNINVQIILIKEENRWCLQNLNKLSI